MAIAAAPAPAPAPAPSIGGVARKREVAPNLKASDVSASNLIGTESCVADIKAVPLDKQSLLVQATKQLLDRCAKSFGNAAWPQEIEWAKKLVDNQTEKSLLKSIEKPQ
jgi:hypothetical protein